MIEPQLYGGLQERKRRAGTENMAGIAGFAKALELVSTGLAEVVQHDEMLRGTLLNSLEQRIGSDRYQINGSQSERLPHILNISFPECDAETMLMNLDMEGIAVSSGSACTSGSLEPSHVLEAMNLPKNLLSSAIRFSFGLGNTNEEMKLTAEKVETILERLRSRK
ncbi:Cysteine desulfurase [compost metagenome]